ncbi:MAG: hypothetical protein M0Q51_03685 [Bacteroidales bacterium]|nr:hypothetical protein [Bacteroidales bacterium]
MVLPVRRGKYLLVLPHQDIVAWIVANHGWHLLTSPVSSQAIQPNFVPDPPTANEDFYSWDELNGLWLNSKLGNGTWNSGFDDNFIVGKGYLCAYITTATKNFTGTLNNASTSTISLSRTEATNYSGWNLLGNPFPSAIQWNTAQESIIRFNENATEGFDNDYDAHFLAGYAPQFYSLSGEEQLSTNTMPYMLSNNTIAMGFVKNDNTNFSIEAKGLETFATGTEIWLQDLKTGAQQKLNDNPVYSLELA